MRFFGGCFRLVPLVLPCFAILSEPDEGERGARLKREALFWNQSPLQQIEQMVVPVLRVERRVWQEVSRQVRRRRASSVEAV